MSGCATQSSLTGLQRLSGLPQQTELVDVPFFPDDGHYCGPAALATTLTAAGKRVLPERLVPEVFLPGRKGSLQIEMLAAARRHGAVAILTPDTMEALLREVAGGHPVLVLQNLGLSWAPSWHYAVVVGYDLNAGHLVLRSGTMKRQELNLRTFGYTWDRSDRWAFVALPPGRLPVTATEEAMTEALIAFERNASSLDAVKAYRSGVARWPDNPVLAMGLGNALYAAGDYRAAEKIFHRAARMHGLAAAYNNQAQALIKLKRYREARRVVKQGLAVAGNQRSALAETQKAIEAAEER